MIDRAKPPAPAHRLLVRGLRCPGTAVDLEERTRGRSRLYVQFVCQTTQLHGIRVGL